MLVDLPGYGYRQALQDRWPTEWQELIFAYLRGRARLRRVLLLIDARRGVMDSRPAGDGRCSTRLPSPMAWC